MAGIVVGVDGSGHSRKALERAAAEAVAHGVPLTVLVVHQAVRDVYGSPSHYPEDAANTAKVKEAAQAETDQVIAALDAKPTSVTVTSVHGLPADELVKASQGADMLVLGRRGMGGFARLMMGSVSSQVAAHAHCPVLIVPQRRLATAFNGPSGLRSSWPRGPRDAGRRGAAAGPRRTAPAPPPVPRASTAGRR